MINKRVFLETKFIFSQDELDAGIHLPGWYFWGETWYNAHGPFSTKEECEKALENYYKEITNGPS